MCHASASWHPVIVARLVPLIIKNLASRLRGNDRRKADMIKQAEEGINGTA